MKRLLTFAAILCLALSLTMGSHAEQAAPAFGGKAGESVSFLRANQISNQRISFASIDSSKPDPSPR